MHREEDLATIAAFYRRVQSTALLLGIGWLLWLLAPILTPFALAALLGWLGDPMVDRLERRMSRNWAVTVVFSSIVLLMLLLLVLLLPVLEAQVMTLVDSLPGYRDWLVQTALPWLERRTGLQILAWFDPQRLFELIRTHWQSAGGIAAVVLGYVSRSGIALLAWLANLALLPVLTFFFLRDWDLIVERIATLVPRSHYDTVRTLAQQTDEVLGGFLRGQMLVMLILGVLYALGLWLVGLDLGILIGLVAGLLTFVPYLGPASIVIFGGLAALVQFGDWQHLLGVGIVFTVGQLVESFLLTPVLVGDRIGLHPMAVIFAVMAGGTLFGFLGMLLALPVAAVANVLLRYAQDRYRHSRLYAGDAPVIVVPPEVVPDAAAPAPAPAAGVDAPAP